MSDKTGSVYPLDVLKIGGVDMTDPGVIRAVMDRFGELQTQLEIEFEDTLAAD